MQFTDMAQIRDVDKDMLQRTRAWLLARRDGNGGFSRNAKALDSFGRAPEDTTNAYITWALVESGEKDLAKEIACVKTAANASRKTVTSLRWQRTFFTPPAIMPALAS